MQAHLQKFAHVVEKAVWKKLQKWKILENPKKWRKHAILTIIKSSHMKFQEVVRKLHVLIIQDHFSNLICVLKSF